MEETSLSVDEMNALRARIGLAPLRTGGGGNNGSVGLRGEISKSVLCHFISHIT